MNQYVIIFLLCAQSMIIVGMEVKPVKGDNGQVKKDGVTQPITIKRFQEDVYKTPESSRVSSGSKCVSPNTFFDFCDLTDGKWSPSPRPRK